MTYVYKNPRCPQCGKRMNRLYYYKTFHKSKTGKWYALGWGCLRCKTAHYGLQKTEGAEE